MSIASEISRLQSAKADLKTAIEGKGVTVPSATTLDGYAGLVDSISGGGGAVEIKTVSASISNTKALFDALVPSIQANKTYVIAEYEAQDQTLYNGISFLLVHTNSSGNMVAPTIGMRYRNGTYNTCAVATNYDAAVTVGDKFSVRIY